MYGVVEVMVCLCGFHNNEIRAKLASEAAEPADFPFVIELQACLRLARPRVWPAPATCSSGRKMFTLTALEAARQLQLTREVRLQPKFLSGAPDLRIPSSCGNPQREPSTLGHAFVPIYPPRAQL